MLENRGNTFICSYTRYTHILKRNIPACQAQKINNLAKDSMKMNIQKMCIKLKNIHA